MKITSFAFIFRITALLTALLVAVGIERISATENPAIEILGSKAGRINSATLKTHAKKVCLSGIAQRHIPYHMGIGAHVEVDFLDDKGQLIEQLTDLVSTASPSHSFRNQRFFVVSWPVSTAQDVRQIQAKYVPHSHFRYNDEGEA